MRCEVRNKKTGKIYPSIKAVANEVGLDPKTVARRINHDRSIGGQFYEFTGNTYTRWENGTSMGFRNKPVRCVETGAVFRSVGEASEKMYISHSAISKSSIEGCPVLGYHFVETEYEPSFL